MFKKVFYIIAVVLVGFLVLMNVSMANIVSEGAKIVKEEIAAGNYEKAASFYGTWFDGNEEYSVDLADGGKLIIYSAIGDKGVTTYKLNDKDETVVDKTYGVKDNALNIMLFEQKVSKNAYIELTFRYTLGLSTYTETITVPYVLTALTEDQKEDGIESQAGDTSYHFDKNGDLISYDTTLYDNAMYGSYYDFIPLTVFESNVYGEIKSGITSSSNFSLNSLAAIKIIDSVVTDGETSQVVIVDEVIGSGVVSFNEQIHTDFAEIVRQSNECTAGFTDLTDDEINELFNELNVESAEIIEEKGYIVPQSISIVFGRTGFILKTGGVMLGYTVLAAVLGFFVLRTKKNPYAQVRRAPQPVKKPVSNGPSNKEVKQIDNIKEDLEDEVVVAAVVAEETPVVEETVTEEVVEETPVVEEVATEEVVEETSVVEETPVVSEEVQVEETVTEEVVVEETPVVEEVKEEAPQSTGVDISSMTVAELKALAKLRGITGFSTMKKAELIEALTK